MRQTSLHQPALRYEINVFGHIVFPLTYRECFGADRSFDRSVCNSGPAFRPYIYICYMHTASSLYLTGRYPNGNESSTERAAAEDCFFFLLNVKVVTIKPQTTLTMAPAGRPATLVGKMQF